jgi:flagellar hook-length control protein FliK
MALASLTANTEKPSTTAAATTGKTLDAAADTLKTAKPGEPPLLPIAANSAAAAPKDATATALLAHAANNDQADDASTTAADAPTPAPSDGNSNLTPAIAMAPAPAAAAPASVPATPALPLVPHSVAQQVAISLSQAAKTGDDHIQIQLQPADLGAIDVKLNVGHDGRVMAVLSADRSDTLNLLRQDASSLTQALRDAGLQADNSSLSFNLRGGGSNFDQQAAQSGYRSAGASASTSAIDDPGADLSAAPVLRRHSGSLDIHV